LIWLVNSDSKVAPGALRAMVQVALQDGGIGAVGSVVFEMDRPETIQFWGGGGVNCWTGQSRHRRSPGDIDFVSGASMLLRSAALEMVGLFDQATFFMYWEDTDLGFRLRKAGWRLAVADDAHLWHKQAASLGQDNPAREAMFARSAVRFLRRYAVWPVFSVGIMMGLLLIKRVLLGRFARARAVLEGYQSA
jgi:GT2 family glycosyltransferase